MTLMALFPDRTQDIPRPDFEFTGKWWLREDGRLMLGVKRKDRMGFDHYEWRYYTRPRRFLWWTWEKKVEEEYPVYTWEYSYFWVPETDLFDVYDCGDDE